MMAFLRLGTRRCAVGITAVLVAACGSEDRRNDTSAGGGAAGGANPGGGAPGGGGSTLVVPDSGPEDADLSEITNLALVVTGPASSIALAGAPGTIQLSAAFVDGTKPNNVAWSVDDTRVGSVDQNGLFRAKGYVAGTAVVSAQVGMQKFDFPIQVTVSITENPGNVPADTMTQLAAGGTADTTFKWLHPYDKTIFPRGLAAPSLQLAGTAADFAYLKLSVGDFTYQGYFGASTPVRVEIPQRIWEGATLSTGTTDWLTVEIAKTSAGAVTGPITEKWRVAQGSMRGVVYYNTYQSRLPEAYNIGAILAIKAGDSAKVVLGGCTVCHSVSSKGNVLASGQSPWTDNPTSSSTWNLSPDTAPALRNTSTEIAAGDGLGRKYTFAALTPDGSMAMVNGVPANWPMPRGIKPIPGPYPSRLVDTATGADIPTTGWTNKNAVTPAFSHDGTLIAYSNRTASQQGHILSVMDFDGASTFSNERNVVTLTPTTRKAGWPSFLPDAKAIVFQDGDSYDTLTWPATATYAQIHLVDLSSSNAVSTMNALNGYDETGQLVLPYGAAEEKDMAYEPTVLPVPVGGFYWVMFSSRRCYGNTIAPGGTVASGQYAFDANPTNGTVEDPTPRKKLWIAAVDMDYAGRADPSHPAFYLPGQELEAGNMRAFAALEPCKADGATCESGAECCNGFCRQTGTDAATGEPILQCVAPPANSCSNIDEVCNTSKDCCKADWICVNGRCALPPPPPPK